MAEALVQEEVSEVSYQTVSAGVSFLGKSRFHFIPVRSQIVRIGRCNTARDLTPRMVPRSVAPSCKSCFPRPMRFIQRDAGFTTSYARFFVRRFDTAKSTVMPIMNEIKDPARMLTLAVSSISVFPKARSAMNKDIVNPIPQSIEPPKRW